MIDLVVRRYVWWFSLWAALLISSLMLTLAVARDDILPGDAAVLQWVQDQRFPGLDLSRLARAATSTEVVLATGAVIAITLWLLNRRREAVLLAAGIIILPILQHGIKEIVDRPRPDPDVAELRASYTSPAFPAGHVMSATVLYVFLLYLSAKGGFGRPLRFSVGALSAAVLLLTGLANVYVGVHWPSDVLGGYLWGLVLVLPLVALDAARLGGFVLLLLMMRLRSLC